MNTIKIDKESILFDENRAEINHGSFSCEWQKDIVSVIEEWYSEGDTISTFSSGSTGKPKEFIFTKGQVKASARLTADTFLLKENTTALLCLPAKYVAGKMMILRALINGWDLLCVEPSSNPLAELNENIDFVAMTPMQVQTCLDTDKSKFDLINKIIVGGAAVSETLMNALQHVPCAVFETYGMTETLTHIAVRAVNGGNRTDYFSALSGVGVYKNENGCLAIDASHLELDVLHTNDLVDLKNDSQFSILGRKDNVINSGGVKVIPELVEQKIKGIIDGNFYLIGEDDELLGEKVVLKIEAEKVNSEAQILLEEKLYEALEKYEVPKKIVFQTTFDRTKSGKIIRR